MNTVAVHKRTPPEGGLLATGAASEGTMLCGGSTGANVRTPRYGRGEAWTGSRLVPDMDA